MDRQELEGRWTADVAALLRYRAETGLEPWPQVPSSRVPPDLAPFVDLVGLLSMDWEHVVEAKKRRLLTDEFVKELDRRMLAIEPLVHAWDVATGKEVASGTVGSHVSTVRRFCEAIDTAAYWSTGERYLDETLRT